MDRMTFTYSTGDRVVIRHDLSRESTYYMDDDPNGILYEDEDEDGEWWRPSKEMVGMAGQVVTIADCVNGGEDDTSHYTIEELPGGYYAYVGDISTYSCWTDEMFSGHADNINAKEIEEGALFELLGV